MADVIHFTEQFCKVLAKYFAMKSVTDDAYNHDIDAEFSGNDTVHIFEIATTEVGTYDKTVDPSTGSRFGKVTEVGDHMYTFKLTQDDSLDRTIDRGNNNAQNFIKRVASVMKAYTDKRIRPKKDKYRLGKWVSEAGIHMGLDTAPTEKTIVKNILDLHSMMIDAFVPADEGILYIPRTYVTALRLSPEWSGLDSLGGKTLPKGSPGWFDGLAVRPVSSRIFPANCYFAIFVKESIIAPEKINLFRAIKDSENMDGDRVQYRCKHDAFVMPSMCDGAAAACAKASIAADPTVSVATGRATLTSSGNTIYYTLDGSDPRYNSAEAKVYSTPFAVKEGDVIRCCAKKEGLFTSAAVEHTVIASEVSGGGG